MCGVRGGISEKYIMNFQHNYDLVLNQKITDLELEFLCFLIDRKSEEGGLGRFGHFRKICDALFPKLKWNPWLELQIESLCDDRGVSRIGQNTVKEMVWTGCGAAGKTFAAALFAVIWWLAAPHESIVILTSTTSKMVRRRIWPVIQNLHHQVREQGNIMGHLVDSKTTLQHSQGDDKHAIFAIPVKEGQTSKAAANIQGMHARRIFVEIDEATDVPVAILTAAENLKKGSQEFIMLKVGNANSRLDPLGEAMEPKDGWSSIAVDTEEWETKKGGYCLHFDGFKSPNVKAGKTIYPFLYTYEDYIRDTTGEKVNTLEFWMYVRGFPAPDGVINNVLPEALIFNNDGLGQHKWISQRRMIGAWDPGFGGDPAPLYFGQLGDIEQDKMGVQIIERVPIQINPSDKLSVDYQIARQVIRECHARGVAPDCFGMDATAIGRGVFAIVYEEWSPKIHRVEFGASPSLDIVSADDPRKGTEVYSNCVTEMWFRVRRMVEAQQIKGFTPDSIRQFGTRIYSVKNKKIHLEPKAEYKSRTGRSPDDADAVAVLCEVARKLGATTATRADQRAVKEWLKSAKELDSVFSEVSVVSDSSEETDTMFNWSDADTP